METLSADLDRVANTRPRLYSHRISKHEYRVVHVLPGKFSDDIQCVLETRSFRVKTRYEALSYQWGDESIKKSIQVAEFRPTSKPRPDLEIPAITLKGFLEAKREAVERHAFIWKFATWVIFTTALFYWSVFSFFAPLTKAPSNWRSIFIPGNVFAFVLVLLAGLTCEELVAKGLKLLFEITETKPWRMGHSFGYKEGAQGKNADGKNLEFLTVEVTTNLALALTYLRPEKGVRTLWIDALCINQKDNDEKSVQIQKMDWIYANASPVVIWLGGYHGLYETESCPESSNTGGDDCEHIRQIEAAFDYIWYVSGWRLLLGWYFRHNKQARFEEARPGLCQLARREYWERLWVIQEVALATGCVQIQCGQYACDLGNFESDQYPVTREHRNDKELQDDFQKVENFRETIKGFRYSFLNDREGPGTKMIGTVVERGMSLFFHDSEADVARFHEQAFPHKLQRLLLKTAGHFKCRDDEDRLRGVLGIAGGAKKGSVSQLANLIETLSSPQLRFIIAMQMDALLKKSTSLVRAAGIAFILVYASWSIFYEVYAKHWPFMRPNYVVAEYKKDIGAVTENSSRKEFFTALAIYLARENGSLAFLDAAGGGKDVDEDMPSWVPTWSKEVNPKAYDFAIRTRKGLAQDSFKFINNDKTLQLEGLLTGIIRKCISPAEIETLTDWPWYWAYEILLASPETKDLTASILQMMWDFISTRPDSAMNDAEKHLLDTYCQGIKATLKVGALLLKILSAGSTVVFTYHTPTLAEGIALLAAGEGTAARHDCIMYVPGCFHGLVLRLTRSEESGPRRSCKLVGLLQMRGERKTYSQSEWVQLRKTRGLLIAHLE